MAAGEGVNRLTETPRVRGGGEAWGKAVFLRDAPDWWAELDRLAVLSNAWLDETGTVSDVKPYHVAEWDDRTPLMGEIRREGIVL